MLIDMYTMRMAGMPIVKTSNIIPFLLPYASANHAMKNTPKTIIPKRPCKNANSVCARVRAASSMGAQNSVMIPGNAFVSIKESQLSIWLTRPMTTTRNIIYRFETPCCVVVSLPSNISLLQVIRSNCKYQRGLY